jgi:hypothetical protein
VRQRVCETEAILTAISWQLAQRAEGILDAVTPMELSEPVGEPHSAINKVC